MFSLSSSHRYYLYYLPTDMRKSFDGLSGIVETALGKQVEGRGVYIFINRRRDKIKLLHWENGGLVLYYKRLETGTFSYPEQLTEPSNHRLISWPELVVMIEGMTLSKQRKNKVRYPLKTWIKTE